MDTAVIIAIGIIVFFIIAFGLYVLFFRKQKLGQKDINKIKFFWQEIINLEISHPEQSILKADKLLDFTLLKTGYSGTLGEKLKAAKAIFRDNNSLWSAHKLRNRIAHEMDVKLSPGQAKSALRAFKNALYDLGINL